MGGVSCCAAVSPGMMYLGVEVQVPNYLMTSYCSKKKEKEIKTGYSTKGKALFVLEASVLPTSSAFGDIWVVAASCICLV